MDQHKQDLLNVHRALGLRDDQHTTTAALAECCVDAAGMLREELEAARLSLSEKELVPQPLTNGEQPTSLGFSRADLIRMIAKLRGILYTPDDIREADDVRRVLEETTFNVDEADEAEMARSAPPGVDHFYIYIRRRDKDGTHYIYERTCGTEERAKERVGELAARGDEATYLVNHLIRGAFY